MACVFFLYLIGAWIGQFIFFTEHSSPAVIWAPAGIALAAILLGGWRMAIPIALAQLLAGLTSFGPVVLLYVASATIGYTLQPLYLSIALRRFGFQGSMETIRDAFVLIGVALIGTAIFPAITALAYSYMHAGATGSSMLTDFGRLWAGNLLSVLVIVPLVTSWSRFAFPAGRRRIAELVLAFAILIGCIYIIFWSPLASELGLFLVLVLWSILLWIALRHEPRYMTLAIALSVVIAFLGGIIAHPAGTPLPQQLFGDELVILLFSPLFLIFAAAASERRNSVRELALRVEELNALATKLSAEDRAKNDFIAILAHELRNPLSPIVSTLELLRLKGSEPESLELIRGAEAQAATMRRLLDDLLDVARISRNKITIRKEPVDVRETIKRSLATVANASSQRQQAIIAELPDEPLWVDADPVRLEQIILNLLSNAIRYTGDGGEIRISSAAEGEFAAIAVRDNGIGIKQEDLDTIFKPFHQSTESRMQAGLGIGLSITKRLVELHDGEILVESEGVLPQGSRFTVRLPRSAPPAAAARQERSVRRHLRRILVVDDNKPAATGIGKLLEHGGHAVSLAHSGAEALERIAAEDPEVVFLDIGLPDMSGYDVARTVRAGHPRITLIALTGYGQEEDKRTTRDAGFDFHLTKPVSIAEVEDLLATLPADRDGSGAAGK